MAAALAVLCASARADDRRVNVVASMSIIGDISRVVGGEHAVIKTLVGPDGDVHVYEPRPADVRAVAEAQLVVSNGLGLEGWIDRLIGSAGFRGKHVIASTGIRPLTVRYDDATKLAGRAHPQSPTIDPHAWQNLTNGRIYAANIAKGLIEVDPVNAAYYEANASAYDSVLGRLDTWVRSELAAVPTEKRRVITTHDAFQYYGAAYGVVFLAPVGISTASEPSAGDVASLVRQMRSEHIKALFLERISDPRLMQQLARDGGAVIVGELYSDALSAPDGPAASYVKMFEYNTSTLKRGMLEN